MNQIGTPLPALSPQGGERVAEGRERGGSWVASIRFCARIGTMNRCASQRRGPDRGSATRSLLGSWRVANLLRPSVGEKNSGERKDDETPGREGGAELLRVFANPPAGRSHLFARRWRRGKPGHHPHLRTLQ